MLNKLILKPLLIVIFFIASFTGYSQDTTGLLIQDTLVHQPDTSLRLPDSLTSIQDSLVPAVDSLQKEEIYTINNLVLDSAKIYFFRNNFEIQGPDFVQLIDTLITGVQKYDPPENPGNFYSTLGNPGLAHTNMVFNPRIKSGFNFGIRSFDKYMFHNDSIKYYWIGKPYTHLYYIMGSKKEQNLHIDHSQNVSSWFNIGLRFRYVNAPGLYKNQKGDDKNFVVTTRFQTKDYRYMVLANYMHNKLKMEENGGIVYDTVFEDNVITSRDGIEVNLNTARNSYIENSFYVKQFYKLTKRKRFNANDTTNYGSIFEKVDPGNISYSINLSRTKWFYDQDISDNNGFYRNTFDSINSTHDSTFTYKITNELAWTKGDNAKYQFLTFNFALRYLYIEHSVDSTRGIYNMLIPNGQVNLRIAKFMSLMFYGDFVTGNSNVGDFNLFGKLLLDTKFGKLSYKLQTALQEPGKFYSSYESNNFLWKNKFEKQSFFINKIDLNYKTIWAGLNLINVGNMLYMDSLAIPAQMGSSVQIIQASFRKLFKVKDFSFDMRIIYQKASNRNGIRMPDLIGDFSFYYTKALFKDAAIIQPGIDVFYNTPYKAYDYMPSTRSFFIQDEKELGNYFYTSAYLNLQIKRARIFLRYTNLTSLFGNYSYYTVPSYPMKDGGLRFGISWMFYD